jgi:hypothetical protein
MFFAFRVERRTGPNSFFELPVISGLKPAAPSAHPAAPSEAIALGLGVELRNVTELMLSRSNQIADG